MAKFGIVGEGATAVSPPGKLSRSPLAVLLLVMAAVALAGRSLNTPEVVAEIHAQSRDFASRGWYAPSQLAVTKGTVVKWVNRDIRPHTVTAVNGLFDSGVIRPGRAWAHRFELAGEYIYQCHLCFCNPMTGRVVVED